MPSQEYRDDLMRLYARTKVDAIGRVTEFQQLCQKFAADTWFQKLRDQIELAKNRVETCLDGAASSREQVQAAIKLLCRTRDDREKQGLYHELIVAGYESAWTDPQQLYFEGAWPKIQLKYDFFLSFTCRHPESLGDNPINTTYKQYIITATSKDRFQKADRRSLNLLAEAVFNEFTQDGGVKGYFFPHSLGDNALTEQKLEEACTNSLVFVQLVQHIMLIRPNSRPNYCFFEWDKVHQHFKSDETRIIFIMAATSPDVFKNFRYFDDYAGWHSHICQKDPPYLPEAAFSGRPTVEAIKKLFKDRLRPQVQNAWLSFSDGVPN